MADYRVVVQPFADRTLRRLPLPVQHRLVAAMKNLAIEPGALSRLRMLIANPPRRNALA